MNSIVILAGEGEYGSHRTMAAYADDVGAELPGAKVHYRVPDVLDDHPDFPASSFGDLGVLADADLLVIYTRFRILPDEQMVQLSDYVRRGGNVLGLRTATHAFHYPDDSPWARWNDGFGRDVLGSPWVSHHGHSSRTAVTRVPGEHPVLAGIPDRFTSRSWLYRVRPQPDCRPLLHGEPVDAENAPTPSQVAWVRERPQGRVFYTSLGHPDDFALEAFRGLLVNATRWCLG
ncbi:ThuA domain-containing protein [Streptomyces iranensis]|uniref:ThuA domain-containing protein n=1 Tax=Streptomyces iranensis TaxID=576784 RepID=UPI0039B794EB